MPIFGDFWRFLSDFWRFLSDFMARIAKKSEILFFLINRRADTKIVIFRFLYRYSGFTNRNMTIQEWAMPILIKCKSIFNKIQEWPCRFMTDFNKMQVDFNKIQEWPCRFMTDFNKMQVDF